MCEKDNKIEELEKIEEDLIKEDQKSRKPEMLVSGKSVFEIKRIREKKQEKSAGKDK